MIENKEIEVLCLYYSYTGRETNYFEIVNNLDVMDEEDYQSKEFWASLGGFSITLAGYNTIFSSHNFYNMVKATSFLLSTLYWLQDKKTDWFDYNFNDKEIWIELGKDEMFKIVKHSEGEILLSYYTMGNEAGHRRGVRYFDGVKVEKDRWLESVNLALSEYFQVLQQVIDKGSETNLIQTMLEYYTVWEEIKL